MAQQQCLETGLLPHDYDVVPSREIARALCADGVTGRLIPIKQDETLGWCNAVAAELRQALYGELNTGEGIASAAAEIMDIKVNM